MKKIKKWLTAYFIRPRSLVFKRVNDLNRYFIRLLFCFPLCILALPLGKYGYELYQARELEAELKTVHAELESRRQALSAFIQTQKTSYSTDQKLAQWHQQVREILSANQIQIESIQWEMAQNKQLSIQAAHHAYSLLNAVQEINRLPALKFKEIQLTKLEQSRGVQLQAVLILNE